MRRTALPTVPDINTTAATAAISTASSSGSGASTCSATTSACSSACTRASPATAGANTHAAARIYTGAGSKHSYAGRGGSCTGNYGSHG